MTCMLLHTGNASPEFSGTPSSKGTETKELLHERGRLKVPFACLNPFVDSLDDVEDDVSTLARLLYGDKECRRVCGSTLTRGSCCARDSRNENVPERNANTDCERRRTS
jgi:hypothetical protein